MDRALRRAHAISMTHKPVSVVARDPVQPHADVCIVQAVCQARDVHALAFGQHVHRVVWAVVLERQIRCSLDVS
jgi:hypothetical protein